MSEIDFQNGFIVGMATRGITRSGLMYKPRIWNDSGVYSCFYIDFKKPIASFSTGMAAESLTVMDSSQIQITGVERVSENVYKFYGDISGRYHGITVTNKPTSYLSFADGQQVPPFSVHFYVAGITPYERLQYIYESATFDSDFVGSANDTFDAFGWSLTSPVGVTESCTIGIGILSSATEAVSIVMT